jgi:hypothetical protein
MGQNPGGKLARFGSQELLAQRVGCVRWAGCLTGDGSNLVVIDAGTVELAALERAPVHGCGTGAVVGKGRAQDRAQCVGLLVEGTDLSEIFPRCLG